MKFLFDFLPLLVFFAAFKFYDIYAAAAAAIAAAFVQVGVFWAMHRRFDATHLVTLAVIVVFGALTIALRDDVFIKWKPTVVNWAFAVAILATPVFFKKSALEYLLGGKLQLPRAVWRKLNFAWAAFFLSMGLLNLYVAFYHNPGADAEARTQFWVNFKVFGMTGLTFAFALAQMAFLARHVKFDEDA
ncbi:MAG: septation protein A [Gammaproteobacteria bacterium]